MEGSGLAVASRAPPADEVHFLKKPQLVVVIPANMDMRTPKMLDTRKDRMSDNSVSQAAGLPDVEGCPRSASVISREDVVAGHIKDVGTVDGEDLVIIGPAGSSVPSFASELWSNCSPNKSLLFRAGPVPDFSADSPHGDNITFDERWGQLDVFPPSQLVVYAPQYIDRIVQTCI